MTVVSAGAIAGPMVGGALIPVLGYAGLYLIDTVLLFATLYAVWRLPSLPVDQPMGTPGLRAVWDGLVYLSAHKILLMSFVVDLIAMIFGLPRALFPQLAHEAFGGPLEGGLEFALLFAAMPAGAVLGGIFGGWVSVIRRQELAVLWAITVWGAAIAVLELAVAFADGAPRAMLVVALVMLVIGGAADMSSAALRQSILLGATDDAVRGRLQGIFIVVVVGGPRIADVLHGGVSEVVGPAWTTGGGGLLVILGIAIAAVAAPAFRGFRLADVSRPDDPEGSVRP